MLLLAVITALLFLSACQNHAHAYAISSSHHDVQEWHGHDGHDGTGDCLDCESDWNWEHDGDTENSGHHGGYGDHHDGGDCQNPVPIPSSGVLALIGIGGAVGLRKILGRRTS